MKRKVGDKVKIRTDLVVGQYYKTSVYFISNMIKFLGKEAEIIYVSKDGYYYLDISGGDYTWTDYMIEDVDVNETFTKEEVKDIALHVLNMGMELRQAQMNGYHIEKSGKELLEEYLKTKGV